MLLLHRPALSRSLFITHPFPQHEHPFKGSGKPAEPRYLEGFAREEKSAEWRADYPQHGFYGKKRNKEHGADQSERDAKKRNDGVH